MDEHQQNKTMIDVKVENSKDLNSSQITVLRHNVQSLKIHFGELTFILQRTIKMLIYYLFTERGGNWINTY
jgi:hypothetical protein